jgi:rfaE bifunctional protein nucleotidyltransferase chain/domain
VVMSQSPSISEDPRSRVLDREAARRWRAQQSGRVVFTNGVFDLLHSGHVDVLRAARNAGDCLIVGVNSDASARRLNKGTERPVRSEQDRAYVLAALRMVDVVVLFDEDTPRELIAALTPDILVKGGDYTEADVAGADIVRARGGSVMIVPLTPGHSTTRIVERVRAET